MRARCYVKEIQELRKENHECFRQISLIGETQTKLSSEEIIDTLDDAIDELYEHQSSVTTKESLMMRNLMQLDNPLESAVLIYRYHRGYSWEDIAYWLKMDAKQVKKLHGDALRSLEVYLEEFEEDAEEE